MSKCTIGTPRRGAWTLQKFLIRGLLGAVAPPNVVDLRIHQPTKSFGRVQGTFFQKGSLVAEGIKSTVLVAPPPPPIAFYIALFFFLLPAILFSFPESASDVNGYNVPPHFHTVEHGLSNPYVTAVYQDQQGDTWLGTRGGGLNRYRNGIFTVYNRDQGLSNPWVTAICGDKTGNTWIGTDGGLFLLKNGRIQAFASITGLASASVRALHMGKKGLWIGTHGGGLFLFEPGTGSYRTFSVRHGLSNPFVSAINEDRQGNVWIGTQEGLFLFKDNRSRDFPGKAGTPGGIIYDIYPDPEGVVWIAAAAGLSRYKTGKFTLYQNQGHPFNIAIYRVLEDDRGYLWLTSAVGIICVSKDQLNAYAEEKSKTIAYHHFQVETLKGEIFHGEGQPAGWKTAEGSIWLPTTQGVMVIPSYRELFLFDFPQQIRIAAVEADNEPVAVNAPVPIRFPAGTKKMAFFFSDPEDTALVPVKRKCRLKGAAYDISGHLWDERDEVQITTGNHIVYRDLPAGRYVFSIYTRSGPGTWNPQPAQSFEFFIQRSFFNTPWFYLLVFITGLIAAVGVFRIIKRWPGEKAMMPIWTHDDKYKTFKLSPRESKQYLRKLVELMEREKPYLEAELTLSKLAEKLDMSKEELSQVINRELFLNFNAFLNRYRVEEARKKLRDPKENQFVVLKIAHEVGFNSKSSFNAVFKKMTGMSPREYREKYQSRQ